MKKFNLLKFSLFAFFMLFFISCATEESFEEVEKEFGTHGTVKGGKSYLVPKQEDREQIWEPKRSKKGEEIKVGSGTSPRNKMNKKIKKFIQNHIFWTGNGSILIAFKPKKMLRYIWIDPYDVPDKLRYGADIICITNQHKHHFSPKDIQKINDGASTVILPEGITYPYSITEQQLYIRPYTKTSVADIKITTTPAFVPGKEGQESWRGFVGYVFWLGDFSVWYTGAIGKKLVVSKEKEKIDLSNLVPGYYRNDLLRMTPIDIMIVPIASPSEMTPEFVIELAMHVKAKAIIVVMYDILEKRSKERKEKILRELYYKSPVPLWYPAKPVTKKSSGTK